MALLRARVLESEVLGWALGLEHSCSAALPNLFGPMLRLIVVSVCGACAELMVAHKVE